MRTFRRWEECESGGTPRRRFEGIIAGKSEAIEALRPSVELFNGCRKAVLELDAAGSDQYCLLFRFNFNQQLRKAGGFGLCEAEEVLRQLRGKRKTLMFRNRSFSTRRSQQSPPGDSGVVLGLGFR